MSEENTTNPIDLEAYLDEKVRSWHKARPQATLTDIETMIDGELAQVRKRLVEIAFEEEAETTACPNCEQIMGNNGKKKRQLQIRGGETVRFERTQKRCFHCGTTLFPPR